MGCNYLSLTLIPAAYAHVFTSAFCSYYNNETLFGSALCEVAKDPNLPLAYLRMASNQSLISAIRPSFWIKRPCVVNGYMVRGKRYIYTEYISSRLARHGIGRENANLSNGDFCIYHHTDEKPSQNCGQFHVPYIGRPMTEITNVNIICVSNISSYICLKAFSTGSGLWYPYN